MATAWIPIGLPGSGKSTFYNKINKKYIESGTNLYCISSDKYIEDKAKELGKTYNEVFDSCIGEATYKFNKKLDSLIFNNQDIYIDRTNITSAYRKKIIDKLKSYSIIGVYFNFDINTILNQNNYRDKNIPESIILGMASKLQVPSMEEGFTKILVYNSIEEINLEKI